MSTHKVEVVRVSAIEKHPDADRVELAKVFGYTCVVKKGDFKVGDISIYVDVDMVASDSPAFAFLGEHRRIKSRRFRGVWSQGLLLKQSDFPELAGRKLSEGDDVMQDIGVTRYVPPSDQRETRQQGRRGKLSDWSERQPENFEEWRKYDLENYRRNKHCVSPDETIHATEKAHGQSGRYRHAVGRLWVGSRSGWRTWQSGGETMWQLMVFWLRALLVRAWPAVGSKWATPNAAHDNWWNAAKQNPWIEEFCRRNEHLVLFGEVFGSKVQDLEYGHERGALSFACFDVWDTRLNRWLTPDELRDLAGHERHAGRVFDTVPTLFVGKASCTDLEALSRLEKTCIGGDHIGEGIVIKTADGRCSLKLVSDLYLERAK